MPLPKANRRVVLILLLLSASYFTLFAFPNAVGSKNLEMVTIFQPDEGVPLPYVFQMIRPAATLKETLIHFFFYGYYFYGFPYFALSALALLPLKALGLLGDTTLVMLTLRQMISVLPMLLAAWVLTGLQTGFRDYRAPALFLFLLAVPAVVTNNLWWHPDSLVTLLAVLVIYALDRDSLRFGRWFLLAGLLCGAAAATKGIGYYFALTIAVYLLIGLFRRKIRLPRAVLAGLGFLAAMFAGYLGSNPILIYASVRRDYFAVMDEQLEQLTTGHQLAYAKGLEAALPILNKYYGAALFLLLMLGLCIWGIWRDPRRLLFTHILTWTLPLTLTVFTIFHLKYQYLLPVALPLFSCAVILLPERWRWSQPQTWRGWAAGGLRLLLALAVLAQLAAFLSADARIYTRSLRREQTSQSLQFYEKSLKALEPMIDLPDLRVYHDVRVYFTPRKTWKTDAIFQMLDYDYIQNFDILMLDRQRMADYTKQSGTPVDPAQYEKSFAFYTDAKAGQIKGYTLVFKDDFAALFVRDSLYQQYLRP